MTDQQTKQEIDIAIADQQTPALPGATIEPSCEIDDPAPANKNGPKTIEKLPPTILGLSLILVLTAVFLPISGVSAGCYMAAHVPLQIYWTFCICRLIEAAGRVHGDHISKKPFILLSFLSFVLMPMFNPYRFGTHWLDPFFLAWAGVQVAVVWRLGKIFDKIYPPSNQAINHRILFSFFGNVYLLLGLFLPVIVNYDLIFNTAWFVSQFGLFLIAGSELKEKSKVAHLELDEAALRAQAFVAGKDIEIRYRLFPGIERWVLQRMGRHNLRKGVKVFVMLALAPILLAGGLGVAWLLSSLLGTGALAGGGQSVAAASSWSQMGSTIFLMFWSAVFLLSVGAYFWNLQPSHIILNSTGIGFLWKRHKKARINVRTLVPWKNLAHISLEKPQGQTSNLEDKLVFDQGDGKQFKVRLNAIDSYEDKEWILKAIKLWAPAVSREANVFQSLEPPADYSYTELWLQALSAPPQRERLKPLVSGMSLKQGKYIVNRALGVGGQGHAYLASDAISNESVVLKEFILPVYVDVNVRKSALEQFENEARILRHLDNPQVVKLLDYFVEDHRAYLVLEHIDGLSLKGIVENKGAIVEEKVVLLAKQMCSILKYLHGLAPPVVHRDFTPDNLILSAKGNLKLIDFNVAQQQESTTSGTVVGKQAYLPPEQFRGMPSSQSDIYAMGATLHFLLTGSDPEPISVSHPKRVNSQVSDKMNVLVEKATAIDAAGRYRTIEELEAELNEIEVGSV